MRWLYQTGIKQLALILAVAVVVQILCPQNLLAVDDAALPATQHGGCHESAPTDSPSPAPVQKCCAAGPASQASPPVPYVPQATLACTGFVASRPMPSDFAESSQLEVELNAAPPGFSILRL